MPRVILFGFFTMHLHVETHAASTLSYDLAGNQTSQQTAVSGLPTILAQPAHQLTIAGGRASFSVVVASPATCTYQWRRNGTAIGGATGDSYSIPAAATGHEGSYTVVITNASGPVTSAAATLYLDSNDNGLPDTWEQSSFGNLTQTAMGDFDSDGVSNLDEYLEGTNAALNTSLFPRLITSGIGGVVEAAPSKPRYLYGETVGVTAHANPGYGFYGWSGALTNAANPSSLVMNGSRTLGAVFSRHGVFAWGRNTNGELMMPHSPAGIVAVAAGTDHSLALKGDGTVLAWGASARGQTTVPAGLSNVVQIAAGYRFSMALKSDGTVVVWGDSTNGKTTIPTGIGPVVAIAAGESHCLALRKNGTVVGWGYNGQNQLDAPPGLNTAVAIAASEQNSLALKSDGTVVSWGTSSTTLTVPAGLGGVVALSANNLQHYALKGDGTAVGWGNYGNNVPVGLSGLVSVAAGEAHGMALKADGSLVTWGNNTQGQLNVVPGVNRTALISAGYVHNLCIESLDPSSLRPVLVTPHFALGVLDHPFHQRVVTRNTTTAFAATGLPQGLAINTTSGVISGTPQQSGDFVVTVSATNTHGTTQKPLYLTINRATPVITSAASIIAAVGGSFSHQVTVGNPATTFSTSGLPSGLSIHPQTGLITGTPLALGLFTVTVTAVNAYGTENSTLTIDLKAVFGWGNNSDAQLVPPSNLTGATGVAFGYYHSLALKSNGSVVGWGYNGNSQTNVPAGLTSAVAVAAGERHSLALRSDGTVAGWGYNSNGQATPPAGLAGVVQLAACYRHSMALKSNGEIVAWGLNGYEQLTVPIGLSTAVQISTGERHSAALKSDGTVVAWGNNTYNQLSVPTGLTNVVAIACGNYHTLALKQDGTVTAWGYNGYGQSTIPANLTTVVAISAGDNHSVALKQDGTIVAWGNNSTQQSTLPAGSPPSAVITCGGDGSLAIARVEPGTPAPLFVSEPHRLGMVTHAFYHRIRTRNPATSHTSSSLPPGLTLNSPTGVISGTPTSTGTFSVTITATNGAGSSQQNLTITINRPAPVITSAIEVAAMASNPFSFSLTASNGATSYGASGLPPGLSLNTASGLISGTSRHLGQSQVTVTATNVHGTATAQLLIKTIPMVGWGFNGDGQTTMPATLGRVKGIAAGGFHGLAIQPDNTVVGWGFNGNTRATPPAGLAGVSALAAGYAHSVALKTDGTIVAWGYNVYGQTTVPAGLSGVRAIAAGRDHTLVLKQDGTVVAWGRTTNGQTTVPTGLNATAIAAGYNHSLAVRTDGTVAGWGNNGDGQTTIPAGLAAVVAVAGGEYHSLALKADGTVVGWGYNGYGQTTPPAGLNGVVAISAGSNHSLALKSNGAVVAWGITNNGEALVPTGLVKAEFIAAGHQFCLAALPSEIFVDGLGNWRQTHFGSSSNQGNAADHMDPDGDGMANLIEFILGGSPVTRNPQAVPRLTRPGGAIHYEYTLDDASTSFVDHLVEWSDTLASNSWSQTGITTSTISQSGSIRNMRAVIPPPSTGGRRFVRLRGTPK